MHSKGESVDGRDQQELHELIEVAQGRRPADLVLRGGRVVNVICGEI